ncbi:MAG: RnfABCDGE type electron transport complex subunit G [Bacillota bacterium]|nr:RnfABCDGE type electron transport complex subunit G [Bacillota bacterium]
MKKNDFYEPLKLGLVLGTIALVIAALLAFVNNITKDKIMSANQQIIQNGLHEVLSDADSFIPMTGADLKNSYNIEVKNVYLALDKNGHVIGYCATAFPKGYGGKIETIVGMNMDGVITGAKVTSNMSETVGLGAEVQNSKKFTYQYKDKKAPFLLKQDGGDIDAITSATITSRAVTKGVNAAAEVLAKNSIYGTYAQDGEIINGKYVIPDQEKKKQENSDNAAKEGHPHE